ncbi:FadR family transcriptional regulator (plasmid) [Duffyella gerundensis]|jgi:DNA-binding FadR family transcriptional regulator|uniref:FadR/GntR family transcriptional regulator n=1 Tax=Duffyella TaxID=3026546 RepID=UPI001654254A|nr:FadR/GntR family transcriptional regulator [Duffyella gerundensis]QTO56273.1 FadR family transcriptional regulator [Duffyella gerundensis]UCB33195.1 FadR family transcriptional regulator [Duffyella gerundensis]
MPIKKLENPRIYRQIADQLKQLIDNNEFPPGSRLPAERELASQLQVSRASVREALIALEVIGLVDVRVGNGVIVRQQPGAPSQEPVMSQAGRNQWTDVDDELNIELDFTAELPPFSLLQTRRLIEPETAALAARNASDEELAAIRQAYEQNCRDNRQGSATHPGDRLFHIRIAQASGNPAYAFIIAHLLGHRYGTMFRSLQQHYTPQDMPHRSESEHLEILTALEARDSRAAKKAMKEHLDAVINIFGQG